MTNNEKVTSLCNELAMWLEKYNLDQVDEFRFVFRDVAEMMLHCYKIAAAARNSTENSTDPNDSRFIGITDQDAEQFRAVYKLLKAAANILEDMHE